MMKNPYFYGCISDMFFVTFAAGIIEKQRLCGNTPLYFYLACCFGFAPKRKMPTLMQKNCSSYNAPSPAAFMGSRSLSHYRPKECQFIIRPTAADPPNSLSATPHLYISRKPPCCALPPAKANSKASLSPKLILSASPPTACPSFR